MIAGISASLRASLTLYAEYKESGLPLDLVAKHEEICAGILAIEKEAEERPSGNVRGL